MLLEVCYRGVWYRYLTNELDPTRLPAPYAVALYWQRWRIEDCYAIVKRLLGLAYFWVGSEYGVQSQLWATWILYAAYLGLRAAGWQGRRAAYLALLGFALVIVVRLGLPVTHFG